MSKFFKELLRTDFFEEKTASEHEAMKNTLDSITPEVLEKLAEEIGVMMDQSPMVTLEEKLASDDEEKKEEKKDEPTSAEASDCEKKDEEKKDEPTSAEAADCEKKDEDKKDEPTSAEASDCEKKDEDKKDEPTSSEASDCEKKDEDKKDEPTSTEASDDEDKKEEKKDEPTSCEASLDESPDTKEAPATPAGESDKAEAPLEASQGTETVIKEADEENNFEMMKKAYELAGEKLAEAGYSVADYVFNKTASEDIACFIADKAEKLAFLSDRPVLMVADEILGSVSEKLG